MFVSRILKLFILTRVLDVVTTLMNVSIGGRGVEGNPMMRVLLIKPWYLVAYQILITLVVLGVYNKHKLIKTVVKWFNYLSLAVILANLIVFIYVY